MRSPRWSFGSAFLLLAVTATACASPREVKTAAPAPPAIQSAATTAFQKLADIGELTSINLGPASDSELEVAQSKSGTWISLGSRAQDYLSQERARWIAGIVISETWKVSHETGDDSVIGGELESMSRSGDVSGDGTRLTITSDLKAIMFTNRDGETPSRLVVPDRAAYTAAVEKAAAAADLTVRSISFTESAGTVVQIDELASDPHSFLTKYPRTNPGLTLDPSDVEGVFLVVHDPQGKIVKTSVWSTGSQSGEGGPGPDYGSTVPSGDASEGG